MGSSALWAFLISVFLSPLISWGHGEEDNKSLLSIRERDSLRYHLENFSNEMDLLIRNQRVDHFDLQRQERDMATLKVFERVPLDQELVEMKYALTKNAKFSGLLLTQFEVLPNKSITPSLPPFLYTDSSFHIRDEQLVERIKFVISIQGPDVRKWGASLPHTLIRYVKVDHIHRIGSSWQISAHAYRFRNIRFPKLQPKDPLTYLPTWARRNTTKFAQAEPTLWTFVKRIESLAPRTAPLYETRGKFLLNDARLNFFIRLTKNL